MGARRTGHWHPEPSELASQHAAFYRQHRCRRADKHLKALDTRHVLQYGSPAVSTRYLQSVSEFLTAQLSHEHDPATIFATPGNSGGLALVARTLTRPGDAVLIEDPSYFLAHQIFRDMHLDMVPLRQHPRGCADSTLDIEYMREVLSRGPSMPNGRAPKLLYLVPSGNNPTGRSMGDRDRAALVRICSEAGVRIVADDVYELLQWRMADAPRPLRWHAKQIGAADTVISLGSWSKLLGPGLRLGVGPGRRRVFCILPVSKIGYIFAKL